MNPRHLIAKFGALAILLAGAFACVLGASTARWWMLGVGLPLVLAAVLLLAWEVIARTRAGPPA